MNFDDILRDPGEHFDSPTQVLNSSELSHEQKIEVLQRWEDDARQLLRAQSEGMEGENKGAEVLKQVQDALEALGAEPTDT